MLAVTAGIVVVAMGRDALAAQRHLNQGRSQLALTRSALATADVPRAMAHLNRAQTFTAEARAETSNWLWRSTRHVPLVGPSAAAVSTSADVANQIASHVLPGLLSSAEGLDLPALRAGSGLRLEPLIEAAPQFTRAARQVTRQDRRLAQLNGPLPGRLHHGVQQLRDQLRELRSSLRDAGDLAQVLPPLLGGFGPRRYLVVVENPAEARGTGGLIGAYGVLTADRGQVRLPLLGPNGDLASASRLPVDLGSGFATLYGDDAALWGNANLSPHFPDAARIWLELWREQFGEQLDGVISTDPVALGVLVGAIGPLVLEDGTELTGTTTARFVMQDAYQRYPTDRESAARDRLLVQVGRDAVERVLAPGSPMSALSSALRTIIGERRLRIYSTNSRIEGRLLDTAVGGGLSRTAGPALSVVVNNGGANKLDVYLKRYVSWQLGTCEAGHRRSLITVRLTNTAPPAGLPPYVTGQTIRPLSGGPPLPRGSNRELVTVFTTRGSQLTGAELDGQPVGVRRAILHGRTATAVTVDLVPGGSSTLVLQTREPDRPGRPRVEVQPLVLPQETVVAAAHCSH
jgi:hypothetical protein